VGKPRSWEKPPATSDPEPDTAEAAGERSDLWLRIAGGVVAVAGGLVSAVIEVFLAPLRIDTVRLPVSVLLAIAGNLILVWFTYRATGRRGLVVLPFLVWMVVMIRASGRTSEGDLLLTGDNWVGLVTIFAGTAAFALGAYRLIVPRKT
jgi:hypothetical protein